MRTILLGAVTAIALALTAEPAHAQVRVRAGVNPWTGNMYRSAVARNPWTGTTVGRTTAHNPWTGATATRAAGFNPWTGGFYRGGAAVNPWTGQHAAWGWHGGRRW
jgi:hypothetical protein